MSDRERLIQLIYDGVTDDAAWTAALAMIADAVRAAGAGLGVQDMATHEFGAVAQSGIEPAMHATYERLAPENRIWQAISRAGRPMADQMVTPKPGFLRSALHAEDFVPQGFHSVMAAPVLANGSHCGVVVAFGSRGRGDFEASDLAELDGLASHLSRAIGLRLDRARLIEDLQARNHVLDDAPDGVLLLDATLRVHHVNQPAQVVLARRDGLLLRQGRLVCGDARDNDDLQKTLHAVQTFGVSASGGWVVARRRSGIPLLLQVRRVRSADVSAPLPGTPIVARIKDPDRDRLPTPALLRRLFGLTLGEARAVLAVSRTQSQDAAARHAGVARTTLRTQLHHAYEKLGLHDRADLLRLLAGYGFG
jgi:DNA-binding CsgD family transcriptional regulator/GAF domain-containing protein